MRRVFADTGFWLAVAWPGDQWEPVARSALNALGECRLVTTDEVLTEFLASMAGARSELRISAADTVETLLSDPTMEVIPQSRDSFLAGLDLYRRRPDKAYSLTDCISMQVMRREGLTDVLTNDRHFQQEGFRVLLLKPGAHA